MALADDMARLGHDFVKAHEIRSAAVGDIRTDTATMLSDLREAHETMTAELRERLTGDRALLAEEAAALRQALQAEIVTRRDGAAAMRNDVAAALSDLNAAHAAMSEQLHAHLADDRARLAEDGAALRDELQADVAARRSDVAGLLGDLNHDREAMAQEQHERLAGERAQLAEDGAALKDELQAGIQARRSDVAGMLGDLNHDRKAMAEEQHERLADDRARLAEDVAGTRSALQADLSEAHAAWASFNRIITQLGKVQTKPKRNGHTETTPPRQHAGDDLTPIRGIGQNMQARLNDLGIFSFAQLAAAGADMVRDGLGEAGRVANVDAWIVEARQFTQPTE